MGRVSASSNFIACESPTSVQFISMRRTGSEHDLHAPARVANQPATVVARRATPSAPPSDFSGLRADFTGLRSGGPGPLANAMPDIRPARADSATQTDGQWEAPPPYVAQVPTPGETSPTPFGSPFLYRPVTVEWYEQQGYPRSDV